MLGRGVAVDEPMTSSRETVMASGEFTGRKAAAMATKARTRYWQQYYRISDDITVARVRLSGKGEKDARRVQRPGHTGTRIRSGLRYAPLYVLSGLQFLHLDAPTISLRQKNARRPKDLAEIARRVMTTTGNPVQDENLPMMGDMEIRSNSPRC